MLNEGFSNNSDSNDSAKVHITDSITNPVTLETVLKSEFKEGNKTNPFSNVLLTQIEDEPNILNRRLPYENSKCNRILLVISFFYLTWTILSGVQIAYNI